MRPSGLALNPQHYGNIYSKQNSGDNRYHKQFVFDVWIARRTGIPAFGRGSVLPNANWQHHKQHYPPRDKIDNNAGHES